MLTLVRSFALDLVLPTDSLTSAFSQFIYWEALPIKPVFNIFLHFWWLLNSHSKPVIAINCWRWGWSRWLWDDLSPKRSFSKLQGTRSCFEDTFRSWMSSSLKITDLTILVLHCTEIIWSASFSSISLLLASLNFPICVIFIGNKVLVRQRHMTGGRTDL